MDDAQRAENLPAWWEELEERWPKDSKEQEQMLVSRSWFPVTGFVCWDRVEFRWFACKSSKYNPLVVTISWLPSPGFHLRCWFPFYDYTP